MNLFYFEEYVCGYNTDKRLWCLFVIPVMKTILSSKEHKCKITLVLLHACFISKQLTSATKSLAPMILNYLIISNNFIFLMPYMIKQVTKSNYYTNNNILVEISVIDKEDDHALTCVWENWLIDLLFFKNNILHNIMRVRMI